MKLLKNLRFWLFVATFFSISFSGSFYLTKSFDWRNPITLFDGLPLAISLIFILLCHELGHYFAAKWWQVETTGPLFIPMPFFPLGTFGAFIKLKNNFPNRKALFDVGVAGPWAGIFATVIAALGRNSYKDDPWILNQISFGVFVGILLTLLNLFPFGSLDGGHLLYSVNHKNFKVISIFSFVFLTIYLIFFQTFLNPLILAFFWFVSGGFYHSPTVDDGAPLGLFRGLTALLTVILFFAILLSLI